MSTIAARLLRWIFDLLFEAVPEPRASGHRGTSKDAPEMPMSDGPRSAVPPAPMPSTANIQITLSPEASAAFVQSISNPPPPNDRLRDAFKAHAAEVEGR